jgi:hypothetical protein
MDDLQDLLKEEQARHEQCSSSMVEDSQNEALQVH